MAIGVVLSETSVVLDTNILIDWRYGKLHVQQAVSDYIARAKKPPALTSINVFEVLYGFENSVARSGSLDQRTAYDRMKSEALIQACSVLPFDQTAATIAAYIYPRLSQSERNKHWKDLFIASTALAHGHGIATRNRKDFELMANHLPSSHSLLRLAVWKP
jgi:predicted nucleic acid-binding protein